MPLHETLYIPLSAPQTMGWIKEMRKLVIEQPTMFNMTIRSIRNRIVYAVQKAGLQGRYGGHSLRIGMDQDLAMAKASIPKCPPLGEPPRCLSG